MTREKKNIDHKLAHEIAQLKKILRQKGAEIFQFKNVINNVPGDVYWKNREGIYRGINARGRESLRRMGFVWRQEDIIGKKDLDIYESKTAKQYRENDLLVMETGRENTTEEFSILPSGEKIIQLSTKRPLRDRHRNVIGIVGSTIDITYLKKIEENFRKAKESAEKSKTEFLYNVRHDIRTPFSGLLALSTLLEAEEKNPQKKEFLHDIAQSAQELLDYFNEILEYMELEDSTVPILYKPFNLREVFREIITMLQPAAKQQFIELGSHIDKKIPDEVIGDRYRVHRILLNLASNAIKFTKEGQVILGADLAKQEGRRIILKIWVKDTGIGIPEDKYNVIFERLSRLTASYSGIYKGTGLGLWAVKRLIEELGGQVFVESELGKGSLFTCLLPFENLLTN